MENKKYIIKKLSPWMMDELVAFSNTNKFDIIFLRKQDEFYAEDLQKLEQNDIQIYTKPQSIGNIFKKFYISLKFIFLNLGRFKLDYNFVLGFKSIIWFMKLDLSKFSINSNMHAQFATQGALIAHLIKMYYNNLPKYSFTFHAHDIYFDNKWFRLLVRHCQKSFSISEFNIKYVEKKYGGSDKYTLSRLGVFVDDFDPKLSISKQGQEKMYFGLLSRFVEKKGILYLLKAMKILKARGMNNIHLILAGDGPLKESFIQFIGENNLKENVAYIGTIKGKTKIEFFENLDVFILPSIKLENDMDGIPVVLMEAIACGIPLISTDVSGISEICINNYNGFLVEEKNVDILVESMIEISTNEEIKKSFSLNSLELSKQYNIQYNSDLKLKELNWI